MSTPTLPFADMTDDEVRASLAKHKIGLTVEEARKVQQMLKRAPTVTEATIWGIQGSEHCSYKSSRRFLKQFPTTGKHVILGPKEDSGVIAITDGPNKKRWGLVVSHESHNHPSQVVPYEGAATGVGGCVRDVLCMGARVIGSMDSLRLGDLKDAETRSISKEVIRGVAGYGNALGIPNLGGDTVFDTAFNLSCLVNVVSLGLLREDELIHSYVPAEAGKVGYDIIIVGKATDKSGFGGAAFASVVMEGEDAEKNSGAVQEPNPFLERHLLQSTYDLFDWLVKEKKLDKVSFKDLGAGGNVCASVEQVAPVNMGAVVDLNKIHVALPNLPPEVIGCAETQERFCWVCHPSLTQTILKHYNETWDLPNVAEGARASVVGKVQEDPTYTLMHNGEVVCSALATDITSGLQYVRPTRKPEQSFSEPALSCSGDRVKTGKKTFSIQEVFMAMLSHPTHASKSRVFRHYDKNIIGNTVIEPGEADASVIMPLCDLQSYVLTGKHPGWTEDLAKNDAFVGVALASGGNGRYGRISPYLQGANAVVENMRNVAAVGALPRCITDCLNYGNPEIPEQLWALEQGVAGISDALKGVNIGGEAVPVISGNVSLYNATKEGPIDPTANVCVVGVMPDARKAVNMQLKKAGSPLFLLGERKDECGGSAYYQVLEQLSGADRNALLGANVPSPDFADVKKQIEFVSAAVQAGLVHSTHDISDGGLLLALFEMTLPQRKVGGEIGVRIDCSALSPALRSDTILFSETGGFVLEANGAKRAELEALAKKHGCTLAHIGETTSTPRIVVERSGTSLLDADMLTSRQ
ncbi:MAG TPA: phosphoribosylformylglycinamidine synthase subunit PurL, partial [Candidatus Peribacteria bacterium]|nr:phosphoribosylformylglycinamidine synthase subunit PurL [Candidatus Peribacteria bacterium]